MEHEARHIRNMKDQRLGPRRETDDPTKDKRELTQ